MEHTWLKTVLDIGWTVLVGVGVAVAIVVLCAISVSAPGRPGLNFATVQDIATVTADGRGSIRATVTLPEGGIVGARALTSHHFVVSEASSEAVDNVLGGPPGCT